MLLRLHVTSCLSPRIPASARLPMASPCPHESLLSPMWGPLDAWPPLTHMLYVLYAVC